MKRNRNLQNVRESGSTLLELMFVVAILTVITGAILTQLGDASQRMTTEQNKVDNFDEARDFVDEFFRDINQIGYPNGRIESYTQSMALATAQANTGVAVGLVQINSNSIWFEGDINGSGVVEEVQYQINGSGTCTLCLQRSAVAKVAGNPLTGQGGAGGAPVADWGTEVNDVVNTNPIFTYYDYNGNKITTLPADINNNPTVIASVKTIHIALQIQNNSVWDPKTHLAIQSNFEGEVSLNNCSMATTGLPPMSCQ